MWIKFIQFPDGCNHLKENFPSFSYKIYHAYLGSNDYQIGVLSTNENMIDYCHFWYKHQEASSLNS